MIKAWLQSYQPQNRDEEQQALRQVMQEIALAGLYRVGFFEKTAFYGGSALRIFYGLPRFSEDLDFSLLGDDAYFSFDNYAGAILAELESLGIRATLRSKDKASGSTIESVFLKTDTIWRELILDEVAIPNQSTEKLSVKIKLEVDKHPPLGFNTEEKLLLKPFSCYIKCFSAPDLFAGKMHALLFRKWKSRVKGRDWFDLEWYIRQGIPVNCHHLSLRASQSGDWPVQKVMNKEQLMAMLQDKIAQVSFSQVKEDIMRFIPDSSVLDIWSASYFADLIQHLKVANE